MTERLDGRGAYRGWKNWDPARFGTCTRERRAYFAAELAASGLAEVRGLRVMELGFGNGEFAAWCRDSGATYAGLEVDEELIRRANAANFKAYSADIALDELWPLGATSLVAAFDVFEHLSLIGLRSFLSRAADSLAPGGLILARVPSGDSPFARAIQHGDLTHQITLGSSAIRQLAMEANLQVVQIREPVLPLQGVDLKGKLKRIAVSTMRRLVRPLILHGFMGSKDVVLNPNLVFVLRKA